MKKIFIAICASLIFAVELAAGSQRDQVVRGNLAQLKASIEEIDLAQAHAAEQNYFDPIGEKYYVTDTHTRTAAPQSSHAPSTTQAPPSRHGHFDPIGEVWESSE